MGKGFRLALIISLFSITFTQAQTLLTINDTIKISKAEFERSYNKNNSVGLYKENTNKDIDDYLQLFINYKLKVLEALSMKLDTNKKFLKEYNGYVKQLSEPYLVDTAVDTKLLKEAYERSKWTIRTSHILVKVDLEAPSKDTLKAYQKAIKIRDRIIKGENFDTLATKLSEDPSAKTNHGDIGYMSVFETVYEYENAMYTLESGQISMPIRTKFGYHILKVTDKKTSFGEVRMAHIIVLPRSKDAMHSSKFSIDEAYAHLLKGDDFGKVASEYSDDRRTKSKGGEFPGWIDNTQRFPQKFKDVVSEVKVGEYSKPFETEYGWHIIKILEKRPSKPYEEAVSNIKSQIAKDASRGEKGKQSLVSRLKKEYNFVENKSNLKAFANKVDTSILGGTWKIPQNKTFTATLCSFAGKTVTESDFANWIVGFEKPRRVNSSKEFILDNLWNLFVDNTILGYEKSILITKYPELAALITEYHDGMLLFDLTDKMIWTRSSSDSAGLQKFYSTNKSKYMWQQRVEVARFTCKNAETQKALLTLLAKRSKNKMSDKEIVALLNKQDTNSVVLDTKKYQKGDDATVDKMEWKAKTVQTLPNNVVLEITNVIDAEPKQLSECKGVVLADYQKELEDSWIQKLRNSYKVSIDQTTLQSIKNKQ